MSDRDAVSPERAPSAADDPAREPGAGPGAGPPVEGPPSAAVGPAAASGTPPEKELLCTICGLRACWQP